MLLWIIALTVPFLLVVAFGAPYVRTLKRQRILLADVFELPKGSLIIDLGAGDGRVVKQLAEDGYRALGIELNPILWLVGWFHCRNQPLASMKLGNYWSSRLPAQTKGVFIFSAERFMDRLAPKLQHDLPRGVQLVSFAFELPGFTPQKTVNGLHLYHLLPKKR